MPRTPIERLIPLGVTARSPATPAAEEKPLLPLRAAAKRMGIGLGSLKALTAAGTVYAVPVGVSGKYFRVPIAEIEKFKGTPKASGTQREVSELTAIVKALDR